MNSDLHKKALNLSYFTVGYNIIEGIVSILAASLSGSIALLGFGLDSFVESFSGFIMIWRFKKKRSPKEEEKIEKSQFLLQLNSFSHRNSTFLWEIYLINLRIEENCRKLR